MTRLRAALVAALLTLLAIAPQAAGAGTWDGKERRALRAYAVDTWASFEAMVYPSTGLPADKVDAAGNRSIQTSPTNIATYMWSTLAARDLQIITPREARARLAQTLDTLSRVERHEWSGMYYNWYDAETGAKLRTWPEPPHNQVAPFLSEVDNGWLAAALMMVDRAVPQLREEARALHSSMDFGFFYDPAAGLMRGGFWDEPPPECNVPGNYRGRGPTVYYTCHHYGSFNTEPRIGSYIAIAKGQVPATHYFKGWRTFPDTCDWSWQEMKPEGVWRTYLGVDVFEGTYKYAGMRIVPSWGGSMFEALMVPLLVPEEQWGTRSWAINHPLYVEAQIHHGLDEAEYGYWGFSPSNNPAGGYREYGVDPIGLNPDGYTSDQERTTVDYGFPPCRPGQPEPTAYGQGVVTPHAAFLALDFAPDAALLNIRNLQTNFKGLYGWGGFFDSVNVRTRQFSPYYLALDQGMIMAAIANELRNDRLQHYFSHGQVARALRPLMAMEEFMAGPAA
ncbi:MAG: DUF3131 domain-containing protein [Actinobacteria bacterium]|nr:DUF3131 domain-containing protein [Actinomycetota bacterium]